MERVWARIEDKADLERRERGRRLQRQPPQARPVTPVKYKVGASFHTASVNVYTDGTVLVAHSGCEIGQGIHTKVVQAAAHALSRGLAVRGGVPMSVVAVQDTSTSAIPNMAMTGGSTTSEAACSATMMCCDQLVERLKPLAAKMAAAAGEGRADAGGADGFAPTWAQLAAKAAASKVVLKATATFERTKTSRDGPFVYHNFGAAASEVELDVLTGETNVVRTDLVYDCGKSLNPAVDLGQAEGGLRGSGSTSARTCSSTRRAVSRATHLGVQAAVHRRRPGAVQRRIPAGLPVHQGC